MTPECETEEAKELRFKLGVFREGDIIRLGNTKTYRVVRPWRTSFPWEGLDLVFVIPTPNPSRIKGHPVRKDWVTKIL